MSLKILELRSFGKFFSLPTYSLSNCPLANYAQTNSILLATPTPHPRLISLLYSDDATMGPLLCHEVLLYAQTVIR